MDCALSGQILLAHDTVTHFPGYAAFSAHLHDLGGRKIKHGHWIALYSCYDGAAGQPSFLEAEPFETPSGAVPLVSRFYIEIPTLSGAACTSCPLPDFLWFASWKPPLPTPDPMAIICTVS